jgi:uncharacterized protein (TIGR02466 family)
MNEITLTKQNYFSSPIYHMYKPEWISDLNNLSDIEIEKAKQRDKAVFDVRNQKFGKDVGTLGHSFHSYNLSVNQDFAFFNQYVGDRSREILNEQGYDLSNHLLAINDCWVQELSQGGHHSPHVHSNNHISGFYYLKCSDKTSFPIFHDPRPGKVIIDLPEKDMEKIDDSSSKIYYLPKPGDLYFFNSYLTHEYSFDFGVEPFRFIHFNIQAIPRIDV